jgi:hypothetical protein
VHVHRAGATEEVVAPHLLQELGAGEHPARVLRQILQQLEFLVGEVERTPAQPCRVGALVDDELAEADLAEALLIGHAAAPAHQQPQSGVDLGGAGAWQQDLVEPPLHVDGHESALVHHGDDGYRRSGGAEQPTQTACSGEVSARVDDRHVGGARLE